MKKDKKEIFCRLSISLSAMLVLFCLVATFVPGSEYWFYIIAALLAIPGIFVKKTTAKIISFLLLGFCIFMAVDANKRGNEYKEWISRQPPMEQQIKELEDKLK